MQQRDDGFVLCLHLLREVERVVDVRYSALVELPVVRFEAVFHGFFGQGRV